MARAAVLVDVDRSLLTGRPGRVLRGALHGPLGPAVDAAATLSLSTQLALLAVEAGRGRPDAAVRKAATAAAAALVEEAPYLRPLLDDHRAAGASVLLVSAAPPAIAEPLGDVLGTEAVAGTDWAEGRGLLAPLEGPLVWARTKAQAGAAWLQTARIPKR